VFQFLSNDYEINLDNKIRKLKCKKIIYFQFQELSSVGIVAMIVPSEAVAVTIVVTVKRADGN